LIVILLIINGGGVLHFQRKRNQFLQQSKRFNHQLSLSVINSEYTSFTITTDHRLSPMIKPEEFITSTPNPIRDSKEKFDETWADQSIRTNIIAP
jgi:hypothetical protein